MLLTQTLVGHELNCLLQTFLLAPLVSCLGAHSSEQEVESLEMRGPTWRLHLSTQLQKHCLAK